MLLRLTQRNTDTVQTFALDRRYRADELQATINLALEAGTTFTVSLASGVDSVITPYQQEGEVRQPIYSAISVVDEGVL